MILDVLPLGIVVTVVVVLGSPCHFSQKVLELCLHVLHNHSLLLTEVKPFEHSANVFCSICVLRNNLLTLYTEDLNHVCKLTVHTYKGPYSVFSLDMHRQSPVRLPLLLNWNTVVFWLWILFSYSSSPFFSFQVISFLFLKSILYLDVALYLTFVIDRGCYSDYDIFVWICYIFFILQFCVPLT